jgi:murein tripeptide amidase MpaA
VGGLHARELINPDALIYFAFNLAESYRNKTDLVLGGRTYTGLLVRLLIDNMDIFILPLANPDGRAHVLDPVHGDRMWRGNRAPNPQMVDCNNDGQPEPAIGVDVNRNFDFLWSSGIGTSTNPCSAIYKGPQAFSEPESQNIRKLLDTYPHIGAMIDVHSYSELVIHPWGDDESQTTDPAMNFANPAFNGQRGQKGDAYKEYIPQRHLDWFLATGKKMREGITAVRGRTYALIPGVDVYGSGISATSSDYSYSRHFVDATKRKVFAFAMETGPEVKRSDGSVDYLASFQPPYAEATCIMEDIQPAFMELCISVLCGASDLFDSLLAAAYMVNPAGPSGRAAQPSRTGKKYVELLEQNRDELMELARADTRLWRQTLVALKRVLPVVQSHESSRPRLVDEALVQRVDLVLSHLAERGSPKLRRALESIRADLQTFTDRTVVEGLREIDKSNHH